MQTSRSGSQAVLPLRSSLRLHAEAMSDYPDDLHDVLTQILEGIQNLSVAIREVRQLLEGTRKDFYTAEEVAEITGRSAYTVRRWLKENRLTGRKVEGSGTKGKWLVARDDLNRLVAAGRGDRIPAPTLGPA